MVVLVWAWPSWPWLCPLELPRTRASERSPRAGDSSFLGTFQLPQSYLHSSSPTENNDPQSIPGSQGHWAQE